MKPGSAARPVRLQLWVLGLHSSLSSADQSKIFEPPPRGMRKARTDWTLRPRRTAWTGPPARMPAASASGTGLAPAATTPVLGPPLTNLQRDWAHPCAATASGGGSLLGIGGVWAQVIVATNIAETSITIDDIVCAHKHARAQPNKRTTEANARTDGRPDERADGIEPKQLRRSARV